MIVRKGLMDAKDPQLIDQKLNLSCLNRFTMSIMNNEYEFSSRYLLIKNKNKYLNLLTILLVCFLLCPSDCMYQSFRVASLSHFLLFAFSLLPVVLPSPNNSCAVLIHFK
jgi:hypothetical protein